MSRVELLVLILPLVLAVGGFIGWRIIGRELRRYDTPKSQPDFRTVIMRRKEPQFGD